MDYPQALKQYALANYEQGGHWVFETWDHADYVELFERHHTGRTTEAQAYKKAMTALRREWELTNELQSECRW
jgi:hypothetical protein